MVKEKSIEDVVLEVTGCKPKRGEDRQDFLRRILDKINGLPDKPENEDDPKWDDLTEPAQLWANAANKADKADKAIPDFGGSEQKKDACSEGDANDEESTDMAAKKAAKRGGTPAAKGKDKDDKKETRRASGNSAGRRASSESKGPSTRRQIKQAVVKNPSITVDKLKDKFGKEMSPLSISSIRSDTLDTMRVLKAEGLLGHGVDLD